MSKQPLPKSVSEFMKRVPTNTVALNLLFAAVRDSVGLSCPKCQCEEAEHCEPRLARCRNCGQKWHFLVGTPFEWKHHPRAYLVLLECFRVGFVISSLQAAKLLDISQSTAWEYLQCIRLILTEMMVSAQTAHTESFLPIVNKRSRETPANQHPAFQLAAPAMHSSVRGENSGQEVQDSERPKSQSPVQKAIAFCSEYFHGISKKYLQLYVTHWGACLTAMRHLGKSLLMVIITRRPIHTDSIAAFSTPATTALPLL